MKQIKYIIAAAAVLLGSPALRAQSHSSHPDPIYGDMVREKYADPNGDGTWTLTLKSYATGSVSVIPTETMAPADIIFAMDLSGSMKNNIGKDNVYTEVTKSMSGTVKAIKETTKAMTAAARDAAKAVNKPGTVDTKSMSATNRTSSSTKNWTYSNVTANATGTANYSHVYKDANGDYYVVRKYEKLLNSATGKSNVYAIGYVDKNGKQWYLTTDGVSETYKDITGSGTTQWNGTLYKGWTYRTHSSTDDSGNTSYQCRGLDNGNETATNKDQWYYLHSDGEYYPVRRAADLPDASGGNTARAAWVVIDGETWYLHGDKLDTDYDHTITSQYIAFWFAPLYKGGWQYSSIKAATSEGGHYYQYTDGKRYPVQKATEVVEGVTTYQAFIDIPGVGKRYLYGTKKLSETPCPFATANDIKYFFGELYTGGWSSSNITDGSTGASHYYLHTDGEYYPVRKETSTNNFQAYVDLPEGKFYFDGNGLSTEPYTFSTTKYVALYFGTLYTMTGWSYSTVTDATAGDGHYYKHTNGYYYPVLKEDLGADAGSARYQLYVEVPEGKRYLWGHSLHDGACPYSAATAAVIWYGTLYKGGWTYKTITVNGSDDQGYSYLHTDGEYYPVFHETVTIGGATTYQDYVILPDGNKWYLCGNEISREPYPYAKKNTVNNWFGPLYSGAWTYANIKSGSVEGGHFYKHTDGEYYPVLKENNGEAAGATRYQVYVMLPEGKRYLYGSHLSETPYPFATRNNSALYYGELFTGGWTYSNITAGTASGGHYYKHTDGMYYPVKKEKLSMPTCYEAYVELPHIGKMYLHGSTLSSEPYPYSTEEKATLYFGSLYKLTQYNYTKYEGMNRAIVATIEEMSRKAKEEGVHHRIALVQYANPSFVYSSGIRNPHLQSYTNKTAKKNSAVLQDFKDITDDAQVAALTAVLPTTIDDPDEDIVTGNTREAWGLSLARGLFLREGGDIGGYDFNSNSTINDYEKPLITGADHTNYNSRKKFVIVIGDGEDNDSSGTSYSGYSGRYKEPKYWADQLKADVEELKVFVVHVSTSHAQAVVDFENYVSSNKDKPADDLTEYRYDVDYYDEAFLEALLKITGEISTSGSSVEYGPEAVVRDFVDPQFNIPEDAEVQLFTSNCIGVDNTGETPVLVFEEDWETFNGSWSKQVGADGIYQVIVTGFDFAGNWCGDHGDGVYSGKQLIIQFTVSPNDNLIGGEVPTNGPESGVYPDDETEIGDSDFEFPIPYIGPYPVHIQISKTGLLAGDSAVFLIWRKETDATSYDKTGDPYMRIVLKGTDDGSAAIADIRDLDPNYHYLIEESTWSWKYTPTTLSLSTQDQKKNPFEFSNTLKTDITTKNAEASYENNM